MIPQHLLENSFVPTSYRPNDPGELGRLKAFYSARNEAAQQATQWNDSLEWQKDKYAKDWQHQLEMFEMEKPFRQSELDLRGKAIDTQRYGIDTSAKTSRYSADINEMLGMRELDFKSSMLDEQRRQSNLGNIMAERELQTIYGDQYNPVYDDYGGYYGDYGYQGYDVGGNTGYDNYDDYSYIIDSSGNSLWDWNADY